jgi:hypothetical protein
MNGCPFIDIFPAIRYLEILAYFGIGFLLNVGGWGFLVRGKFFDVRVSECIKSFLKLKFPTTKLELVN